jgi:flavin-dependent dehydrogenase
MSQTVNSPGHRSVEHLIIGGGPAGSMVAITLALAGHPVTLLEKERSAHHKVCGEFLSREAVDYLDRIGVAPRDLGAVPIRFLRLSSGSRAVETELPFPALSLSRRVLDEALLARAVSAGCNVQRGATVDSLTPHRDQWLAGLNGGESFSAKTVFLATGKHDLRGWTRDGGKQCDLVGFKLHWQLAPTQTEALREWMELYLFAGGYGGLSLVEGDTANLCLVVQRSRLRAAGGWSRLLAAILQSNPQLQQSLQGANPLWERPLAISPIPYGYLAGRSCGLWCVGDQFAAIPSFSGDGISIAMHSAALAAHFYLSGQSVAAYNRVLTAQLRPGMRLATWLSRAMVSLPGRSLAPIAFKRFPNSLQWIATSTRIPPEALFETRRTGIA